MVEKSVRRVIALYISDYPADMSPYSREEGYDWSSYMSLQNKPKEIPSNMKVLLEHSKKDPKSEGAETSTNPYDYDSVKQKDLALNLGDNAKSLAKPGDIPNVNNYDQDNFFFGKNPSVKEEENALYYLYKSRENDLRDDQRFPEVSLDTKRVANVLSKYFSKISEDINPLQPNVIGKYSLTKIVASDSHTKEGKATLPKRVEEASKCTVVDISTVPNKTKGKYTFNVRSAGSPNVRTVTFQFLRESGEKFNRQRSLSEYPVLVGCSCPSFLWWGAQWYALQDKYMYLPMFRPSRVAPSPRDRVVSVDHNGKQWRGKGQGFRACKHIIACMNTVQKYKISGGDFKAYRPHGPRQKVFNPTQWSKSYGVFSFSDIIELQHRNKIPNNLISSVSQTENFQEVEKFLTDEQNGWKSWSDKEKIAYVKDLAGHPDLILYIMLRDFQITKRQSALLREKLFDGIDQVLQFNDGEDKILHQKPQLLEEYVKDREELKKLLISNPIKDPEVSPDVNKATSEIAEEILKTKGEVETPAVKTWISSLGNKVKGFLNRFITKFK